MNTPQMATAFHVGLLVIFASLNHKSFVCTSDYCRSRKLPCSCVSYFLVTSLFPVYLCFGA